MGETYLCNFVDWHLREQETMPWLSGAAYRPFKDFSTPVRPDNPIPCMNQKGVVERDFTKKEAYYVFQSYWTSAPMAHLYGHSWPVRWGDAGELKMVKVYSNCAEAELFVNGKSYGRRQRNSQDFPAAGLHWNVSFAAGRNEVRVVARQGRQTVEDRINFQYETRKWGKPTRLTLTKATEANDLTTFGVKLFDAQGVQCLDAANRVEFSRAGAGRLLDDLGTSSGSRKVQPYNGRAIIRLEAKAGHSVVAVQSPGLEAVLLPL